MTMMALIFVFNGIIGALLHVLLHYDQVEDLNSIIRDIAIGGLAGYIYYNMYAMYSFPNGLITIIVGYFAKDIIYVLFEKKFKQIINILIGGEHG